MPGLSEALERIRILEGKVDLLVRVHGQGILMPELLTLIDEVENEEE